MSSSRSILAALVVVLFSACGSRGPLELIPPADSGTRGLDGGLDGAVDGAVDGAADASLDGGPDAGPDAGPSCPGFFVECDGTCVDPRSSLDHCGGCGNACGDSAFCLEGACSATCPLAVCGGECADLTSSPSHCGECGNECGDTGFCRDGSCRDTCPAPLDRCAGECIDVAIDPANCGGCGVVCPADQVCGLGVCSLSCPAGTTNCAASCVDTATNVTHCGGCGIVCGSEDTCRTGRCIPVRDLTDADGDTIVDLDEDAADRTDTDADGTPDFGDLDSDGDGYPDAREAGDADPGTPPVDSDRDGTPDFRDLDSDADGLSDAEEARRSCLDPTRNDTDGDGQSDLAEVTAGTDPCDPGSRIPEFFFILPTDDPGGESAETLTFDTNIRKADIHFSVDTTGSMGGEINNLQSSLTSLVIPGIQMAIMDTAFGVSEFEDFPVGSFGNPSCRGTSDLPFRLLSQVTTDIGRVATAIDRLDMPLGCGSDLPESGFEAAYQIAAGGGVSWSGGAVPVFTGDPTTPGGGTLGGVGFRDGAFPIIIHITDDVSHVQSDYAGAGITGAHNQSEAVAALNALRARMIGIASRSVARPHLEELAIATDAVIPPDAAGNCLTAVDGAPRPPVMLPDGTMGCPLVFDARENGSGLSATLVDAVSTLVTAIRFDTVSVRVVDDPNGFIRATIPRSATPPPGAPAPTVADLDGDSVFDSFVALTPGTVVSFTIIAYNDTVPRTDVDQVFMVRLQVIGDGITVLDEKPVIIIVPRAGG